MNNKQAVEIINEKIRNKIAEKITKLVTSKNVSVLDTEFINDAIETVISGKSLLKNTYIFGYYMKDNEKKDFFEHSQGILQYWTEELHRLLIDDHINQIIQEDNFEKYNQYLVNYKNSINKKITSIQNYSKGLIDDIENNFISEIDFDILDEK